MLLSLQELKRMDFSHCKKLLHTTTPNEAGIDGTAFDQLL